MKKVLFLFFVFGFSFSQNYFQQEVNYEIDVKLDDKKHTLTGRMQIRYKNNSPNTLTEMYFHLWPNAYKNKKTAFAKQMRENGKLDFQFAKKEDRGYIDSLDFHINGKKVSWELTENIDIARISLSEPIKPGEEVLIETPFFVKLPKTFSRLGHVGQTYQITQWYPKPAVYDKYGWHPYPYLDQGEFYSEFGSFVVHITVPADYVVQATGNLITPSEIERLKKREQKSRENLSKNFSNSQEKPFSEESPQGKYKTLTFKQAKVHDFAWFAAKDYYFLSDTLKLPESGRIIKVQALFFDHSKKRWKNALKYTKEAVLGYSEFVGEYPYDVVTVVQGPLGAGSGMEYPTITILDGATDALLRRVIIHEVGHNWFYGILGFDERRFAWMDEGLNSFYEKLVAYKNRKVSQKQNQGFSDPTEALVVPFVQGENKEQPLNEWAHKFSYINYFAMVYVKTPQVLFYLREFLGEETFDKAMKEFYKQWKFKHPYPEDMKKVFEKVSLRNLSWWFDSLLASKTVPDFRLKLKQGKLYAENVSRYDLDKSLPSYIDFFDKEGNRLERRSLYSLNTGNPVEITDFPKETFRVSINSPQHIFEENSRNNDVFVGRKMFKTWATPKLSPFFRYEKTTERSLNYLPALGTNRRDGFMAGMLFYYQFFPKHNFEFHALPMYSFKQKLLRGSFGATYRFYFEDIFRKVELRTRTALFADFLHTKNFVEFFVKNYNPRWHQQHKFVLRSHHIRYTDYALEFSEETPIDYLTPAYLAFDWNFENWQKMLPVGFNISFGTDLKNIRSEINAHIGYRIRKNIILFSSGYVGARLTQNIYAPAYLRFTFSGYDAFGEHVLFNRYNEGTGAKQIVPNQGNFRIYNPNSSRNFLSAINTGIRWLDIFELRFDYGIYEQDISRTLNDQYAFSFGIASGWGGIYFPVASSTFQNGTPADFQEFRENISFFFKFSLEDLTRLIF